MRDKGHYLAATCRFDLEHPQCTCRRELSNGGVQNQFFHHCARSLVPEADNLPQIFAESICGHIVHCRTNCLHSNNYLSQLLSPSTTEASQKQHNAQGTKQGYFQAPLLQVRVKGHRSEHSPPPPPPKKTEDGPHKIWNAIMRKHQAFPCVMCKLLLAGMQRGRKQTHK